VINRKTNPALIAYALSLAGGIPPWKPEGTSKHSDARKERAKSKKKKKKK
jgi:hypothetical protein